MIGLKKTHRWSGELHVEGRTSIDHAPGAHDDIANAVAGALVTAHKEPGVANFRNAIVFPKVGVA